MCHHLIQSKTSGGCVGFVCFVGGVGRNFVNIIETETGERGNVKWERGKGRGFMFVQTCSNIFKLDQNCSNLFNLDPNGSMWLKLKQIDLN